MIGTAFQVNDARFYSKESRQSANAVKMLDSRPVLRQYGFDVLLMQNDAGDPTCPGTQVPRFTSQD
jgi:hypothetical protein